MKLFNHGLFVESMSRLSENHANKALSTVLGTKQILDKNLNLEKQPNLFEQKLIQVTQEMKCFDR